MNTVLFPYELASIYTIGKKSNYFKKPNIPVRYLSEFMSVKPFGVIYKV